MAPESRNCSCICHLTKSSLRTVFGFAQGLEPVVPMLELSMIVSLTYDERQSYVARFCNSRPIKWLGEISMSFYMCHMVYNRPFLSCCDARDS